ncbi:NAD(P)-dependent oxidoreductase [Xanthovirga aplysinae]|uniref:NAD(P)-dependent oxidoreductase n=1 Tax=Xanthovirga aplysinae TaxID=2529853 RepID=UPI0012BB6BE5|nr:NAD(P)-dependent oxidoreductase [Xanthovirga aplysinae]MTI31857.1 alanine dehydrogenase [Xanthovirga aplysinae]
MKESIGIGILREGKIPIDLRVPLSPKQAKELIDKFKGVQVFIQSSPIRCFSDKEYKEQGLPIVQDLHDCDILLGIKEVPIPELLENKTYLFFSHTIKKQTYNRELLRTILNKKIRLIDYECLTEENGLRLIAFGRYAGIVGAINGIWAYGQKNKLFKLKRAKDCFDLEELKKESKKIKLPPIKIALTGGGRAANGAMEILNAMGICKVSPKDYLTESFAFPVYTQLRSSDYHKRKEGKEFSAQEFYQNPERYLSTFTSYTSSTDILIATAFWHPEAPALFSRESMVEKNFKLSVIADVTCDINGSIPSTKKTSSIEDPVYDYDPVNNRIMPPFSNKDFVTTMAIDNLPTELPRDASIDFGNEMLLHILPALLGHDEEGIIQRATIAENGKLTSIFSYLQDFVEGKE